MTKKWDVTEVKNIRNEKIEMKNYQQMIDEVAEIVYIGLCQLHKKSLSDSLTFKEHILERTGTDA